MTTTSVVEPRGHL